MSLSADFWMCYISVIDSNIVSWMLYGKIGKILDVIERDYTVITVPVLWLDPQKFMMQNVIKWTWYVVLNIVEFSDLDNVLLYSYWKFGSYNWWQNWTYLISIIRSISIYADTFSEFQFQINYSIKVFIYLYPLPFRVCSRTRSCCHKSK